MDATSRPLPSRRSFTLARPSRKLFLVDDGRALVFRGTFWVSLETFMLGEVLWKGGMYLWIAFVPGPVEFVCPSLSEVY